VIASSLSAKATAAGRRDRKALCRAVAEIGGGGLTLVNGFARLSAYWFSTEPLFGSGPSLVE
jgi:hypothetical protein